MESLAEIRDRVTAAAPRRRYQHLTPRDRMNILAAMGEGLSIKRTAQATRIGQHAINRFRRQLAEDPYGTLDGLPVVTEVRDGWRCEWCGSVRKGKRTALKHFLGHGILPTEVIATAS